MSGAAGLASIATAAATARSSRDVRDAWSSKLSDDLAAPQADQPRALAAEIARRIPMLRDPWVTVEHVDRGRAQDSSAPAVNDQNDLHRDLDAGEEAVDPRRRLAAVETVQIETGRGLGVAARDPPVEARAALGGAAVLGVTMPLIDAVRVEPLDRPLEQRAIRVAIAAGSRSQRRR